MRTRFLRGNTAENNGLTLPNGELSVDLEKKALRLHDGQTLGGFECVGTIAFEPYSELIAGDTTAGFYGEVPGEEFISYGDLSTAVGLSAGTLQHDAESAWLKFSLDGQTLYIAKKTARHSVAWTDIYQAGCVYGVDGYGTHPSGGQVDQGTIVAIGGNDYRVRLIKGAGVDPLNTMDFGYDLPESHGSEWNRLMYPIHSGQHSYYEHPASHADPNADPYASWANYNDSDLIVEKGAGNGNFSWCQETPTNNTSYRTIRGYHGIALFNRKQAISGALDHGWRPVLELVE